MFVEGSAGICRGHSMEEVCALVRFCAAIAVRHYVTRGCPPEVASSAVELCSNLARSYIVRRRWRQASAGYSNVAISRHGNGRNDEDAGYAATHTSDQATHCRSVVGRWNRRGDGEYLSTPAKQLGLWQSSSLVVKSRAGARGKIQTEERSEQWMTTRLDSGTW